MHQEEEDVNSLVRVRAQVMTRDDSSGGWVPLDRGGLSTVSVRRYKSKVSRNSKSSDSDITPTVLEYRILGKRISDQTVILSCAIKKDFEYNKVMPTFHHWRNGNEKYGLAFTTAADGRAFDKGVRIAIDELIEGLCETSPLKQVDDGDDEVFMALNLPVDSDSGAPKRRERRNYSPIPEAISPVGVSSTTILSSPELSAPVTPTIQETSLCEIEFVGQKDSEPEKNYHNIWEAGRPWEPESKRSEIYSYVQFSKEAMIEANHDYSYPVLSDSGSGRRNSIKKSLAPTPPPPRLPLPTKKSQKNRKPLELKSPNRLRCRNCLAYFNEEENRRGACDHGPDAVRDAIDTISCIGCADCIMYHCYPDTESEYGANPCLCQTSAKYPRRLDNSRRCRLVVLTLLSLFVPCLWCYLPLRACHRCGVYCGICGPEHVGS